MKSAIINSKLQAYLWLTGLIVLLLSATALRFYRIEEQSLWNDEGNSARLSERSIPAIIEGTASDIHPPLYYLFLRSWRELLGDSEFGLRAFSAFIGVATIAATFGLARMIAGQQVALVAAGLTAINPALVYYSQETRMYALLAFLAVLSTLLLLRWQRRILENKPMLPRGISYVVCAAAGLYTHYFFAAVLLSHHLLIFIWLINGWRVNEETGRSLPSHPKRKLLTNWFAVMTTIALIFLPWLPVFWQQVGGRPPVHPPFLDFVQNSVRWLAFGHTIGTETVKWPLATVLLLVGLGTVISYRQVVVPAVGLIIPVLLIYVVGATQPEFFKFLSVAVPFLAMLLALGWKLDIRASSEGERSTPLGSLLSTVFLLVILWGSNRSLQQLYYNPVYARADYRGLAARIEAEGHPNAGIILNAPNQWEVFTYYHREAMPVYPLPRGKANAEQVAAELNEIAARHDRLYAIFWGEGQRDPERLVERWLDEHAFKAREEWVGDVRFVIYAVPDKPATEMETVIDIQFGDAITLNGYTLQANHVMTGDIVQVTLFWNASKSLNQRYKVFLHLTTSPESPPIAQRDSEPGGGLIPTTSWQPGEVVMDNHGILIPEGTPEGNYTLLLGLYNITSTIERLPIHTEEGIVDALPLSTIHVAAP